MSVVAVIDYGMGNLHSIAKALQHVAPAAWRVDVTCESERILAASHVVFPGVGAIRDCMRALERSGLDALIPIIAATRPLLGICLGMQALLTTSEENGGTPCLDLIPGQVQRFATPLYDEDGQTLKVPHMGWNGVHHVHPHPLWEGIDSGTRFYFVHSYYAVPQHHGIVMGTADYPTPFAAALGTDNIFAVQFHPEKSQTAGLRLLSNFLRWNGNFERFAAGSS